MRRYVILLLALILAAPAPAHPVPKDNHDRTLAVHLTQAGVVVEYHLELDEFRAINDMTLAAFQGVASRSDLHHAFRKHFAPILLNNVVARLDGEELTFRCVEQSSEVRDHVRCDYRFVADWKLKPGGSHQFTLEEGNYPNDTESYLALRLSHSPKLTLQEVSTPDDELINRPAERRKPGDNRRLRALSATVVDVPSSWGDVRGPMPADLRDSRPGAGEFSRHASAGKLAVGDRRAMANNTPPPEPNPASKRSGDRLSFFDPRHLQDLLFETKTGLAVLLALAVVIGAAHALTPGHGKTLVAAYLVGQHGTVWHAVILGVATTLAHTGSVIIVAIGLALSGVATSFAAVLLNLVGGLLITGLGVWLLMQRLRGAADHIHLGGHEVPDLRKPGVSWWSAVVAGIGGGIIPCFDAIGLLSLAIALQRLWLGVVLLLAFSAGLAAVLVALGLLVVAGQAGARALRLERRFDRLAKALPIVSALVIIGIGLLMTFGSAAMAE